MRRRLIVVFVAISATITMAFVVPLGFLVRRTIEDRAIDAAIAEASALAPVLASAPGEAILTAAVSSTPSGREGAMTIYLDDGRQIGANFPPSPAAVTTVEDRTSRVVPVEGGQEVLVAVALPEFRSAVVRVFVSDETLRSGQWISIGTLAAVGLTLMAVSVLVAIQMARSVVRPSERLASATARLGAGDLSVRVEPEGPIELRQIATALNETAGRMRAMLERERELVGDLSHRLRTPLTKLRVDVDRVKDDEVAAELRGDVAALTATVDDVIRTVRRSVDQELEGGCDVVQVVAERVEFWSALARDENRQWNFRRGVTSAHVLTSQDGFSAAVDVLIDNVFAHTDQGVGYVVSVDLNEPGARADAMVVMAVEDGGPGFGEDALVRGASGGGSTGLGLDIARRVAEEAGGRLVVGTSKLGGSRVELWLTEKRQPA